MLLQFTLDLTLNAAGQGSYAGFILGTAARDAAVPAPGGLALLLLGPWGMVRLRRRTA